MSSLTSTSSLLFLKIFKSFSDFQKALMLLPFNMHLKSTLGICSTLKSTTNFTNPHLLINFASCLLITALIPGILHLLILFSWLLLPIEDSFKLLLLSPELLNFKHDFL